MADEGSQGQHKAKKKHIMWRRLVGSQGTGNLLKNQQDDN